MEIEMEKRRERYFRPSKCLPYPNPYHYEFCLECKKPAVFSCASDLILAFFGVLEEASNLMGFSGGCGSVGEGGNPYTCAYDFLSEEAKKKTCFENFVAWFRGIGHITLLKLHPLPIQQKECKEKECFFFEAEVIKGKPIDYCNINEEGHICFFEYYYGTVTVIKECYGWKIECINCLPENFLCAAYHGWDHDAKAVVEIVYRENLKIVQEVIKVEEKNSYISIFAVSGKDQYRFHFIRLTNGCDILIEECRRVNGRWVSVELCTGKWDYLKLTCR